MAGAGGSKLRPPPSPSTLSTAPSSPRFYSLSPATSTRNVSTNAKSILARAQATAQGHLNAAIAKERARRWIEAVDHYRKLLHSLTRDQLPFSFIPGPDYTQLLLETYYHMGVAFQKLDQHQKSLQEFTNAIEASHIPKFACQVGCATKSFYHTPVYARRAYAYVKCGKIKEAINDSNRAVALDTSNADVYCVRALVWSSAKESRRALIDLNHSFKLNPNHICTLILRGAIISSLGAVASSDRNKDHEKALKLCQDSRPFLDVLDFHNPKMPTFFDRFLWSLNAFHTIMTINLFEGAVFAARSDKRQISPRDSSRMADSDVSRQDSQPGLRGPFKCGSVATYSDNTALLRRKVYSKLLIDSNIGITEKLGQSKKTEGPESLKAGMFQDGFLEKYL